MVVNILLWALFGLLAGVVAKFLSGRAARTDPAGMLLTIALGIVGALVGGFLSSQVFGWDVNNFSVAGFAVAVAGALLVLFLYGMIQAARKST